MGYPMSNTLITITLTHIEPPPSVDSNNATVP